MKCKIEDINKVISDLKCLQIGVDPQTKIALKDTILLSDYNKKLITEVIQIIESIERDEFSVKIDNRKKIPFSMTQKQIELIQLSDEPISISEFTYKINEQIDVNIMKKIKATDITDWLVEQGYLKEPDADSKMLHKVISDTSHSIGIFEEKRTNDKGIEYTVNLYSKQAQEFILSNMSLISKNCI